MAPISKPAMNASELSRRGFLGAAIGSASLGGCSDDSETTPEPAEVFVHGVASGDPLGDRVILWTRVTSEASEVEVGWVIATDPELEDVVASGSVITSADVDFTVKIDVDGLSPATSYFYQFDAEEQVSPIGRTRTIDDKSPTRLRLAVVSCASYAHGYFHVYRRLAERLDLDAVIHLGDYIYEYANDEYGSVRAYEPAHEILTLADYRTRYAHYRKDADLAEAHRQHPFYAVWDDHELANNAWSGGAENHDDATEGPFAERKAAAAQAYAEWMPIRLDEPGKIYRKVRFGDLAELFLLDTRLWGRDEQAANQDDPSLNDPDRTLLGADQEAWLADGLTQSTAKFKIIGQQVMVAELPVEALTNTDQWDGYPAARERFYNVLTAGQIDDVVVLTGDIHSTWAADLVPDGASYDPASGAGSIAVELVVPAVSSPGVPDIFAELAVDILEDFPHFKLIDLTKRGYLVLDVTPERTQGAYYHVDSVETEEPPAESFTGALATYAGENHFVDDGEAAPDGESRPAAP